ncbi:MAG: hypothetical protein AAF633_05055 [Chloroflexota bacterium]
MTAEDRLLHFEDSEISPAELERKAAASLSRRPGHRDQEIDLEQLPRFDDPYRPLTADQLAKLTGGEMLRFHLHMLNRVVDVVESEPHLAPSSATNLPVVGRLWGAIRGQMHQLVLFYVNRSVNQQLRVNHHLVEMANQLSKTVADQAATIDQLKQEIDELKLKEKRQADSDE